ncbi:MULTISPECIES: DAK2 domain-containing protein [Paenibacillus]|uniref:DAK2 domain-containing protein n=1 Tax=Paenibacillus TaxID=44249 RepID=UPI000370DBE1|nr:DAK2 domain-containing protein [Paenibacillus massiliensis]
MSKRSLNGTDFTAMVLAGAEQLQQHAEHVNSLNVFPVPDGDTGTNMNLTMNAGVTEITKGDSASIGVMSGILSKGLLMGARGNSGVILSQLFRGFSRYAAPYEELNTLQFAAALQSGVDAAYKAVVKPVEGTILTVAKEAAKHAVYYARRANDIPELMAEVLSKAKEALAMTQEMLPVLKQVGVVDSGGQGLVYIYEGFMQYLSSGTTATGQVRHTAASTTSASAVSPVAGSVPTSVVAPSYDAPLSAQAKLETEHIEFLYDMEFFINRHLGESNGQPFDEEKFEKALSVNGDSIIVIADEDIVKVHVHSKAPGEVLNLALQYGEITQIRILNMREQHRELLTAGMDVAPAPEWFAEIPAEPARTVEPSELPAHELAPHGFIAVSPGEGITNIFRSMGVDVVLSGGQTMNPSTEDFVNAVRSIAAEYIYILPNNSNIILAAEQARELLEDERQVFVIPSKTIPQGIAAAFAFQEEESFGVNLENMAEAVTRVQSGQVTYAVRDTVLDEMEIKAGHYIGIHNSKIVATEEQLIPTCRELLSKMLGSVDEAVLVMMLTGSDSDPAETEELVSWIEQEYPGIDIEVHDGGQPIYSYLFSVES